MLLVKRDFCATASDGFVPALCSPDGAPDSDVTPTASTGEAEATQTPAASTGESSTNQTTPDDDVALSHLPKVGHSPVLQNTVVSFSSLLVHLKI